MTQVFTPAGRRQAMDPSVDPLFSRYGSLEGMSIVRVSGVLTYLPAPLHAETEGLQEGVDYFIGGHEYVVSGDVEQELIDGGFIQ